MSRVRSRMRCEADVALGPRERAARARVRAAPERDVRPGVRTVDAELVRVLEPPRVAVRRAVEQHHRRAGRDVDARRSACRARARRKSVFTGLSTRSASSTKFGMRSRVLAELVLQLGVLGEVLERGGEQARGRLLARPRRGTSRCARPTVTSGVEPSGIGRERELGEHVLARLAPPVLDVVGEACRRAIPAGSARRRSRSPAPTSPTMPERPNPSRNRWCSRLGHAEQVGDHQHRERLRVRADELAAARRRRTRRAAGRRGAT